MVANQSYVTGDRAHQAILDVEAGEEGLPELIPPADQARPGKRLADKRTTFRKKKKPRKRRRRP